jgi:insulysin
MSSDEERAGLLDDSADSVTHFTAAVASPAATPDLHQWSKPPNNNNVKTGRHSSSAATSSAKLPDWLTETRLYLCGCLGVTALIVCTMLVGLKTRHKLGLSASLIGTQDAFAVLKPENDPRSYQYSVLTNGLKVLVISDPVAKRGAAAMDVRVGQFSDPEDIPGLAHLLEHMLFLGTQKYPDESEFAKFLSAHGGSSNAFTDKESTNYHFDIDASEVEHALDMFSGFFEAPLLLNDRISAEKKAVCSEHQKNLDDDGWRIDEVLRSTSNPAYPFHKFGTGDEESLSDPCKVTQPLAGSSGDNTTTITSSSGSGGGSGSSSRTTSSTSSLSSSLSNKGAPGSVSSDSELGSESGLASAYGVTDESSSSGSEHIPPTKSRPFTAPASPSHPPSSTSPHPPQTTFQTPQPPSTMTQSHRRHLLRTAAVSSSSSSSKTTATISHAADADAAGTADAVCSSLHDALVAFHKKHYSANQMRLTILSPLPVDRLSALAAMYFSNIPNTNAPDPALSFNFPSEPVRLPSQLSMRYDVVPVSDIRQVQLHWFLPGMQRAYRKKIWQYLADVLGDESEGSLKSVLRNAGLVNSVVAGPSDEATHFTIFQITLALTEDGLRGVDEVVTQVYGYVRMVRDLGPQRWLWDQCRSISRVELRFLEKSSEIDTCSDLAGDMQIYEPSDVVVGGFLWEQYDPEEIERAISAFTPANMVMTVVSKAFDGKTDREEKRYGVKYRESQIDSKLALAWAQGKAGAAAGRKMHFPVPNTWVPTDFSVRSGIDAAAAAQVVTEKPRTFPSLILSQPGVRATADGAADAGLSSGPHAIANASVSSSSPSSPPSPRGSLEAWHKLDDTFGDPRANVMFTIHNERPDLEPIPGGSDAENTKRRRQAIREQVLVELLGDVISDVINEQLYAASAAGLSYEVDTDSRAVFSVTVAGYSQHLPRFVEVVTDAMLNVLDASQAPSTVLSQPRFEQILDVYRRSLADWSNDQPYKHARTYTSALLETPAYLASEMLSAIEDGPDHTVTLAEVLSAGRRALKGTCSISSLIHGNMDVDGARKINEEIVIDKLASRCAGPNPNANHQKQRGKLDAAAKTTVAAGEKKKEEQERNIQPGSGKDTSVLTLDLPEPSKTNVNSAALLQCQLGFEEAWGNLKAATSIKILAQMTDDEAFETLRTKENLGYIVFTYPERKHGVLSYTILVESSKYGGDFLAGRIEAFISSHATTLKSAKPGVFDGVKASVMSTLEEPYMTLTDEVRFWFVVVRSE